MRIHAAKLLTPAGWRENQVLTITGGRIEKIEAGGPADHSADVLAPGLIDLHNHGGEGFDPASCSMEKLGRFLDKMLLCGVTDALLAVSTGDPAVLRKSLAFLRGAMKLQKTGELEGTRIRGVHLEGPFLSPKRPGAMAAERILRPDTERFRELFGDYEDIIRLATIAPEEPGAYGLAACLQQKGIKVQAGHTDATYEQAEEAFGMGFTSLCHTFNAARGIHHREPGIVTAALLNNGVFCEAICDLEHLHPGAIRLIYKCKGPGRMVLVSDSTMPTGLPDGEYSAANHPVIVKDGVKRTPSGALSGGICYLDRSVRNLVERAGIPAADALTMAGTTPAERMGWTDPGRIAPGGTARLAAFDRDMNVAFSVIGEKVYGK